MKKEVKSSISQYETKINRLAKICEANDNIDPELYTQYDVKRGLRDMRGKGVLAGLTEIAEVKSYTIDDNEIIPCAGQLFYRGYNVEDLVRGFIEENRFGFEETVYLLIFGTLPKEKELEDFKNILDSFRVLPRNFVKDVIMKAPSADMMNTISKSILTLYSYDKKADDVSINNVLRQSLQLISEIPMLAVYSYHAYQHFKKDQSLIIHKPKKGLSLAEHFLYLLRDDSEYTALEARTLDLCMVLHADHGGGNNSTFTTRVVTSSGTDTYSTVAAALASLKGPKHGGANLKVVGMMDDIKKNVKNWDDEVELKAYLKKILDKKAYDKAGLIYGIGHAVYTISDPRAVLLKMFVDKLAVEKGREKEYMLYQNVAKYAPEVIAKERKMYRETVSANVDFYSGFVYRMLAIPEELYTPLFAASRIAGWSAHRIEELVGGGKIIRPAYKTVTSHVEYVPIKERKTPAKEAVETKKKEVKTKVSAKKQSGKEEIKQVKKKIESKKTKK